MAFVKPCDPKPCETACIAVGEDRRKMESARLPFFASHFFSFVRQGIAALARTWAGLFSDRLSRRRFVNWSGVVASSLTIDPIVRREMRTGHSLLCRFASSVRLRSGFTPPEDSI